MRTAYVHVAVKTGTAAYGPERQHIATWTGAAAYGQLLSYLSEPPRGSGAGIMWYAATEPRGGSEKAMPKSLHFCRWCLSAWGPLHGHNLSETKYYTRKLLLEGHLVCGLHIIRIATQIGIGPAYSPRRRDRENLGSVAHRGSSAFRLWLTADSTVPSSFDLEQAACLFASSGGVETTAQRPLSFSLVTASARWYRNVGEGPGQNSPFRHYSPTASARD